MWKNLVTSSVVEYEIRMQWHNYTAPVGAEYCVECVCLFLCLDAYLISHTSKLYQIFFSWYYTVKRESNITTIMFMVLHHDHSNCDIHPDWVSGGRKASDQAHRLRLWVAVAWSSFDGVVIRYLHVTYFIFLWMALCFLIMNPIEAWRYTAASPQCCAQANVPAAWYLSLSLTKTRFRTFSDSPNSDI